MKAGILPYQDDNLVYSTDAGHKRPRLPTSQETHDVELRLEDGKKCMLTFVRPEDIPSNKRHFVYRPCAANPLFTELGYCCTEYPFDHPGIHFMDRSDGTSIIQNNNDTVSVKESLGWRTSRCDVCIKEGETYWEVEVIRGGLPEDFTDDIPLQRKKDFLNTIPHLRVGISKREASLDAPVGFDSYGYSIRDHSLESIHEGTILQVLPELSLKPGDRLGFLLKLPSAQNQVQQAQEYTRRRLEALTQHNDKSLPSNEPFNLDENGPNKRRMKKASSNKEFQKALLEDIDHSNVIRDHIAIRYKNQLFFEATDYVKTTKPEYYSSDKRERQEYYLLENSCLSVYLNGELLGNAFENLKPFLPPFSELQYREKFYFDYWKNGSAFEKMENEKISGNSQSKEYKKGLLLRNKYVNNNKLGYYPTISCFNGGTAKIITEREKLKFFDKIQDSNNASSQVKLLGALYDEQIAEDIVWDIVDEVEEECNIRVNK